MRHENSRSRVIPNVALAVSLLIAALMGGVVVTYILDFSFEILLPILNGSEGTSSISYGPSNALVLGLLGGLPAAGISYFFAKRYPVLTISAVLKTAWIGPVVTAILLVFFMLLLWPAAAAVVIVVACFIGVACALLFELAGAATFLFSHGDRNLSASVGD